MNNPKKTIIFSGIQPSGNLHIGNYFGAINQWIKLQTAHQSFFCIVDYHAITVRQDAKLFQRQILDTAKIYLAAGVNPKKSIIFQQSAVKEHTELAWILNCAVARISDLNKMTQFKDKTLQLRSGRPLGETENVSVGLFDYPVLMAADILLYNTDKVPVGEDQTQHVELARDLAKRFNHDFGNTFKIPEALINKTGARIMGLDDPMKKMSKSAGVANYIALTDAPTIAKKKIMRAVTDSGSKIKFDKVNQPAIANLLTIYSLLTDKTPEALVKKYANKGYGDFKTDLAEIVAQFLTDFKFRFNKITDREVQKILDKGAKAARPIAEKTINNVKEKLGIF